MSAPYPIHKWQNCECEPKNATECECSEGSHWREDTYGNEFRIDCGCHCPKCEEF